MNQRRFKNRNTNRQRFTLRTVLITAIISSALVFSGIMLVVNVLQDETSFAGNNPMVISGIEVIQDTTSVRRGSVLQVLIGVRIKTRGQSNRLNLSSIEFASRGSSRNVGLLIENARLWSTAGTNNFSPSRQLGQTLTSPPETNFTMNADQLLQDGDNYFWLTADIGKSPEGKNLRVDAECISVFIGTLKHEPDISAPPGSKRVMNNIPYFSNGNGDISSLRSWNSVRDGSGKTPSSFSSSEANFNIQPGHILTNKLNACLPGLVIERSGVLKSSSDLRVEFLEIQGGATFIQDQPVKNENSLARMIIRNGGNYVHNNQGTIPGRKHDFEPGSVVILQQYSSATFNRPVRWGNLVINSTGAPVTDFNSCLANIRGDLEIRSTGENYIYTSSTDSMKIGGNLLVSGGRLVLSSKNNHFTVAVNKKLFLKKGWLSDKIPGSETKGSATLEIRNGVELKAGILKLSASKSLVRLTGNDATWNQEQTEVLLPAFEIGQGSSVTLKGHGFGPVNKGCMLTVMKNGRINCGNIVIGGTGGFELRDFAAISSSHPDGINTDRMKGTIQTSIRIFSSYADYIYTGSQTPQKSGVFATRPAENTINNLVLEKDHHGDVVILEQHLSLKGRLVKDRGSLNKNSFRLETSTSKETANLVP